MRRRLSVLLAAARGYLEFGGEGLAMVGAPGGTQPCRPSCAFTQKDNPGYDVADRRTAVLANCTRKARLALESASR